MSAMKPPLAKEDITIPDWMKTPGKHNGPGMTVPRHFTRPGHDPFESVQWEIQTIEITQVNAPPLQVKAEFPTFYSQAARSIIAGKYLKNDYEEGKDYQSVHWMINRVVATITRWGVNHRYFASDEDTAAFYSELTHILLHQYAAFNSPVWFNFGVEGCKAQGSACFINPADDTMDGWCDLQTREANQFKGGSGAGVNLSPIRSSYEHLSGGGRASGPISLMKGLDTFAGIIKSGGKNRRAAKIVELNADHPDILECQDGTPGFIRCKANEERKARDLIAAGWSAEFNVPGNAYENVFFQNANHSVHATDAFMEAALNRKPWYTRSVTTDAVVHEYQAEDILREIAQAAWECGDPGMQFHDTMNRWNTCPNSFTIWGTNPCSEYNSREDTSCNLASQRLTKFLDGEGNFNIPQLGHVTRIMILAMEIIVAGCDYPSPEIAFWSPIYRNLGLGFVDLGALLMQLGLPYDSPEGRGVAAMLCSYMTATAYQTSVEISRNCGGPFADWERNKDAAIQVLWNHSGEILHVVSNLAGVSLGHSLAKYLWSDAIKLWQALPQQARDHGLRNAQTTLMAPGGTISFLLDCDTTGIEPDLGLKKEKKLVGGGKLLTVNQSVAPALQALGYIDGEIEALVQWVDREGTLENENCLLQPEHLPVFDCAFPAIPGGRTIHYSGHLHMLGAIQPFISMAISKTVNMPTESTVADIMQAYIRAWQLGIKCVAIYRDGCKQSQPLQTGKTEVKIENTVLQDNGPYEDPFDLWEREMAEDGAELVDELAEAMEHRCGPQRRRLPDTRDGVCHKFSVGGHEGYLHVGLYSDGTPGEIFLTMSKEGTAISGLLDAFATMVSLGLQHGVPLASLVNKFKHTRFEPAGFTPNEAIPMATSVIDYIFKWLELKFLDAATDAAPLDRLLTAVKSQTVDRESVQMASEGSNGHRWMPVSMSGPPCSDCGSFMQRAGNCYACSSCGATSGCG